MILHEVIWYLSILSMWKISHSGECNKLKHRAFPKNIRGPSGYGNPLLLNHSKGGHGLSIFPQTSLANGVLPCTLIELPLSLRSLQCLITIIEYIKPLSSIISIYILHLHQRCKHAIFTTPHPWQQPFPWQPPTSWIISQRRREYICHKYLCDEHSSPRQEDIFHADLIHADSRHEQLQKSRCGSCNGGNWYGSDWLRVTLSEV